MLLRHPASLVALPGACLFCCSLFAAPAESPEPAPAVVAGEAISADEIKSLLAKLAEIQAKQDAADKLARIEALKALEAAIVGPTESVNFYIASVKAVEFEKPGKKQWEFDEWKKKNEDRLHDAAFAQSLRLQLRFLKLTLEADTEEKRTSAVPSLIKLGDEMIRQFPQSAGYSRILSEDPFSTSMAARFGLEKKKPEGWPASPLHLGAVHNLLMKQARVVAPKSLPALWEARIKQERTLAAARDEAGRIALRKQTDPFGKKKGGDSRRPEVETESEKFDKITFPKLQWEMGVDLFKSGLRRRGIEGLFIVLSKNPEHPSRAEWIQSLAEMADQVAGESGVKPAAATAPAASPAPSGN